MIEEELPVVSIIVLTYNAQKFLPKLLEDLLLQTCKDEIIFIDSSSSDGTQEYLEQYAKDITLHTIPKENFNHGATRMFAADLAHNNILVYLTQDVILKGEDAIEKLVLRFKNPEIAIAYGKQLPHKDADFFGAFTRAFNYPSKSHIQDKSKVKQMGVKTCFLSNSFAAYKKDILIKLGGFPDNVIISEDTYLGAKAVMAGYKIAYVTEAVVYHSHNYTIFEEFKRYFDIGIFYKREAWINQYFKASESEGMRFIKTQFRTLLKEKRYGLIPEFFVRNFAKYCAYKLALVEKYLPYYLKKRISMHHFFWKKHSNTK